MSSTPTPPPSPLPRANAHTRLPHDLAAWHAHMRQVALSPAAAWARAIVAERRRLPEARVENDPSLGYRLYVVGGAALASKDVGIRPGGHVVLGRHTSCDLVIDTDDAISLRHLLVRASLLDDGLPTLSLLDLDSASGFELADGLQKRAIVGSGAFVFRIGATWCVAFPKGEPLTTELVPPIIRFADEGSYRVNPREIVGPAGPSPTRPTSRITSIPWCVPMSVRNTGQAKVASDGSSYRFQIAIEVAGTSATVRFTERDLDHGILVGRADKCADAGLRAVLRHNIGVSRVHALVIRERDGIRLYDVASLNGISDGLQRRVRTIALAEHANANLETIVYFNGRMPAAMRWSVLD